MTNPTKRHIDITLDDVTGVNLRVEYIFYPSSRGSRDSLNGVRGAGPQLEPDEPADIEITSIITPDDIFSLLSDEQVSLIAESIFSKLESD